LRDTVIAFGRVTTNVGSFVTARSAKVIESFGAFIIFSVAAFRAAFSRPWRRRLVLQHMEFIGYQSLGIVLISGFFIGAVFSLQIGHIFRIFGAQAMLGAATGKSLSRELSPLVTGFLLAGRAGAAITAEIGTMRVTEQVDAMEAMAVDPLDYLVGPRLLASMLMFPILVGIFNVMGMLGAIAVSVVIFDIDQAMFWEKLTRLVKMKDLFAGLQKAVPFGAIISLLGCRFGLETKGGAKGVGLATTNSVVAMLLTLIGVDFVITYVQIMTK